MRQHRPGTQGGYRSHKRGRRREDRRASPICIGSCQRSQVDQSWDVKGAGESRWVIHRLKGRRRWTYNVASLERRNKVSMLSSRNYRCPGLCGAHRPPGPSSMGPGLTRFSIPAAAAKVSTGIAMAAVAMVRAVSLKSCMMDGGSEMISCQVFG